MKVTLPKEKLALMKVTLESLKTRKMPAKGSWAINKNLKLVSEEVADIQKTYNDIEKPKQWLEFDKKRIELMEELCKKDASGNPMIINGQYQLSDENRIVANQKVEELTQNKEYSAGIEEMKLIDKDFSDMLGEDMELEFHSVSVDYLPDMTPEEMDSIDCFVTE
jgi:hypothetical protein